ncbi:hypothetical protein N0V95_001989 [Ascochyta clinopodiicola]|nr:hypothetical protein N0V95_001989 [Ascochyta clinopodiicola]
MKLSTPLTFVFTAAAIAALTLRTASTVASKARWDYGSSSDKRDVGKSVAEWDYGGTGDKRDVVDTDWNYGNKKGEMLVPRLARTADEVGAVSR